MKCSVKIKSEIIQDLEFSPINQPFNNIFFLDLKLLHKTLHRVESAKRRGNTE